jgi:ABC-2 type transport system ATP-binding protein
MRRIINMTPILEIKNLRKDFKGFSLKDINLSLERGFIMGFIGPNGAGKSTTIKLILNLMERDRGEINVFGKDNIKNEIEVKNKIGFVLDENHYYEEITIKEMKRIIAPFYKQWDDGVFNKYVKDFGLPIDRKIKELSKGMKMKFSLAVALSHNAELLIMDEPTSGLDPVVRSELLDILSDLMQDENKGVFFSTHITSDLDKIADYITFINNGEIVFSTTKDDILDNFGLVKGPKELIFDNNLYEFVGMRENQYGFEALVQDKEKFKKLYGNKVVIEKPTLEDIMVYYTRRDKNA